MFPFNYLEYFLGRLLSSNRGRDSKLWINDRSLFEEGIPQNITVTCPEIGPSNSVMPVEYSAYGTSRFPTLTWNIDTSSTGASNGIENRIKEYVILVEDPDAPLPLVPNHGLFYAIPATKTTVTADDVVLDTKPAVTASVEGAKYLRGGFRLGKNLRGTIYAGPRPPLGHGPHRYFYQVIALDQALDVDEMKPVATKAELEVAIKGKIVGYGVWIGVFERKWE
ncbi:uncharacterized protein PV06_05577 [Exophiala oligosperma]|uniref:YbhB/YbcL family Raf kinase inhibitor-like protein n=1 Tax=Exophiala oligosperma TaxID=215243 RepID=A0A0D2DG51_9EURO|nr:uncharacterized protein PV06_05577 [Exophiala oligosperma]KIW41983.1 hypothetical protein PV06_05577 [Exophiala oligosperma]